ncbi:16S rRNA (guanine(527)-N(7))-methyltransferase RsmG [Litoreibacter roseus]|uniref:Ribosomal RNA small subunit methyltransferase G n=1 Tax=Litoreibacter roseus TaxID=2601869 RepID=A0A6N6JF25_9RHOB|nr:16S rRNA (guanine(527)-N(7))-methyltransferase RsmG [Litoreibacter roseus]GFE64557.1 ribosomal RNA small subunit methyltransferase G [Litoreibacter roseus]
MTSTDIMGDLNVSRETLEDLKEFEQLAIKWTKHINLVSSKSVDEIWSRHILDSAQIVKLIPDGTTRMVDLGSGGGFPAIVVAVISKYLNPDFQITMVESDSRKCAFLRTCVSTFDLKATVQNRRIEEGDEAQYPIVTARALASLDKLLHYSSPLLEKDGKALFMKGNQYHDELDKARRTWQFEARPVESLSVSGSAILEITNIKAK